MQDLPTTSHNLVNSIAERVGRPRGFYKAATLDTVLSILLLVFGATFRFFVHGGLSMWYLLGVAGITVLTLFFHSLMPISAERRYAAMAIGAFMFSIPLFDFPLWAVASTMAVSCLFLMSAAMGSRVEIDHAIEIRYTPIFKAVFGRFITGFCMVGVILFAAVNGTNIPFSESAFKPVYDSSAAIVARFYPGAALSGSVAEFGESMARAEAQASADFARLSKNTQEEVIKQGSKQIILGLGIKEKDSNIKLSSVAYGWFMNFLNNIRESVGPYYVYLWSVIFFLIVRSFGALLMYVLYPLGWLLYESSIAMGLFSIQGESRMKEVIKF